MSLERGGKGAQVADLQLVLMVIIMNVNCET